MSELKKYVEKINELIKKYRKELHGSVRDDKVLHLETIKFRLENEINNTKSYEEGTIFRKAMEQSIEERYKHETDNAESYINHVVNPANDVETLLAETALVDIKPVMTSSQGVSTADAVYVADSNVVSYSKISPGETEVANAIGRILNDDSEKGIGNPDIMAIIIRGLSQGDSAAGAGAVSNDDKISYRFGEEMKYDGTAVADQDKKRAKFIKCLNSGIQGNRINFVELAIKATVAATLTTVKDFLIRCICGTEASKIMGSIVKHVVNDTKVCDSIIAQLNLDPNKCSDLAYRRKESATSVFIAECLTKGIVNITRIVTAINDATDVEGLANDLSPAFKYIIDGKKSDTFASANHISDIRFHKILAASICADTDLSDIVKKINEGSGGAPNTTISEISDDKNFQGIMDHINNNTDYKNNPSDDKAAKMFFKNRTRGVEYEKAIAAALCVSDINLQQIGLVYANHGGSSPVTIDKIVQNDKYIKTIISHINSNKGAGDDEAAKRFVVTNVNSPYHNLLIASSLCCDDIFKNIASAIFSWPVNPLVGGAAPPQGIAAVASNANFINIIIPVAAYAPACDSFIANANKNTEYRRLAAAAVCIAGNLNEILNSITNTNKEMDNIIPFLDLIEPNYGNNKVAGEDVKAAQMLVANLSNDKAYYMWILVAICLTGTYKCPNIVNVLLAANRVADLAGDANFIFMMGIINGHESLRKDFVKNVASEGKSYELLASAALCVNANYSELIGSIVNDTKATAQNVADNKNVLKIIPHININDTKNGGIAANNAAAALFVANCGQSDDYTKLIAASLCIDADYSRIAEALNTIGGAANVAAAAGNKEFKAVLDNIGADDKAATSLVKNVDKAAYQQTIATALCASNGYTNITDTFCDSQTVATLAGVGNFVEVMKHINTNTGAGDDAAAKLFLANVGQNTYVNLYAAALCADTGRNMAAVLYDAKDVAFTAANNTFLSVMHAINDNVDSLRHADGSASKNDANKLLVSRAAPPAAPAAPAAPLGEIQRLLASALCVMDSLNGIADVICEGKAVSALSQDANFAAIMTHINNNTGAADDAAANLFLKNRSGQSKANIYAAALCITGNYKNMADALFKKYVSISTLASNIDNFMPVMNALNGDFTGNAAGLNNAAKAFATLAHTNDAKYDTHRAVLAAALCADNNFSIVIEEFLVNPGNISALAANTEANAVIGHVNNDDKAVAAFLTVLNKATHPSEYINLASLMLCAKGDYSTLIEVIGQSKHLQNIATMIESTTNLPGLLMAGHTRSAKYQSLIANILCIDVDLNNITGSVVNKTLAATAETAEFANIANIVDNHTDLNNFMKRISNADYSLALAAFLCAKVVLKNIPNYLIDQTNGIGISGIAKKMEFENVIDNINKNTGSTLDYATASANASKTSPPTIIDSIGKGIYEEEAAALFINANKMSDKNYRKLYAAALCIEKKIKFICDAFFNSTARISDLAGNSNFNEIIQFIDKNEDIKDSLQKDDAAVKYTKTASLDIHAVVFCIDRIPTIKNEMDKLFPNINAFLSNPDNSSIVKKINIDFSVHDNKVTPQNNAAQLFINHNKDMTVTASVPFLLGAMLLQKYDKSGTYEGALATNIWNLVCADSTLLTEVVKQMETQYTIATSILTQILAYKDTDSFSKNDKDLFLREANKQDATGLSHEYTNLSKALLKVTTKTTGGYSLMDYPERLGGILALGGAFLNVKSLVFVAIVLLIMLTLFVIFDSGAQSNKPDRRALTYFPLC
jgi:hypothetical protein